LLEKIDLLWASIGPNASVLCLDRDRKGQRDLPEGGKARHLPVFEIRTTHRSRTISFFLSG
jgi:hypothetical protein